VTSSLYDIWIQHHAFLQGFAVSHKSHLYPLTPYQIGTTRCYTCKLRSGLNDSDSNWRLWNADMKVYRDRAGKGEEDEE